MKGYKSDKDLSATVWLRNAGDTLQMFVAARDDKLVEAKSAAELDKSDVLRVVMMGDKAILADALVGLVGGKTHAGNVAGIAATVTRVEKKQWRCVDWRFPKLWSARCRSV